MNSVELYKLKNDTKCVFLSENIVQSILDIFSKSNIKSIKCSKKQVNVMKSNKIQAKKDLNENKIIMIMNKLSNNNLNELVVEYINNILVDTEEKYNAIMTEMFNKMIKDIKFIENYINFSLKIFILEKKRLNLKPEEFINLIKETIMNGEEADRSACYTIIKELMKHNFFNEDFMDYISNYILSSSNYIDVYNWFNGLNISNYYDKINEVIVKCTDTRERILIESLIGDVKKEEIVENEIIEVSNDIFKTSVENILEEFVFLKSIDEVIEFINTECININNKNLFCKEFITYFEGKDELNDGLILIDNLIKKKILFKSNISKGLQLYLNENNIDINSQNVSYVIDILKFMKNNNITKNIEYIFKKFKVKIYYD